MINRKRTLQMLALIVFAIALSWLSDFLEPQRPGLKPAPTAPKSDYHLTGLDTSKFGNNGKLQYRLQASTLTHYPDQQLSKLELPVLWQYSGDGSVVETRANRASLADNNKTIEMHDNVITSQKSADGKLLAQARTSRLTLQLQQ